MAMALRIRQSLELQEILQITVDQVLQLIACDRVLLYQFAPDWSGQVKVEAISNVQWSLLDCVVHDPCFQEDWLQRYQDGQVTAISDIDTADLSLCHRDFLTQFQVKSNLVIPITGAAQLWGLLIIHRCTEPQPWQDIEIEGLQQLAVHLGIALQQAALVEQLQTAQVDLESQVAARTAELEQTNRALLEEIEAKSHLAATVLQREEFLRQVLDSLFTFVGVMTPDGILIEVNQAPLTLAGLTRQDVIGKPFADSYWWRYAPEAQVQIRRAIAQAQQGIPVRFDIAVQTWGGVFMDIDFSLTPLRDATGQITHLIPSGVDITDRKQSDLQLRQSKEQLEDFFDNASDLIQSVALEDGKFLYVNRTWREVLGYDDDEIASLTVFDLIAPVCLPHCSELFQQFKTGAVPTLDRMELVFLAKDGATVRLQGNINVRQEQGVPVATRAIFRDITAQHQAEQALKEQAATLRSFYDSSPLMMGVVEVVADDILHISDNAATRDFFHQPQGHFTGSWAQNLGFSPAYIQLWLTHYLLSQQQQQPVQFEYAHTLETGLHWLLVTVSFIGIGDSQRPRFSYVAEDISDRKHAEEYLRHMNLVMQNAVEGISWLDAAGHYVSVNRAYAEICGYGPDELVGQQWLMTVHPEDRLALEAAYETMQETGKVEVEARGLRKDGSLFYKQVTMLTDYNDRGQFIGHHCFMKDVSDRKQAEAAIRESEARFRYLADHAPVLIWMAGLDKRCFHFNKTWLDFTGRTVEQEMGDGWAEGVHPEDLQQCLAIYTGSFDARCCFEMEYRLRRFDGEYRWLLDSGIPRFDADGQFLGYIGSCIDISDRKQAEAALRESEARFRYLADHAPVLIWMADCDNRCLHVNKAWLELTGRTINQELGDGWLESLHPEDRQRCIESYTAAAHTRRGYEVEYRLRRFDGEYRWLLDTGAPRFDSNGKFLGYIGSSVDISDRKQAELALKQSEATNRALILAIPDFLVRMRQDGLQMQVINQGSIHCLNLDNIIDGHWITDIMPESIARERIRLAQVAIATGEVQYQEYQFAEQDQTYYEEARITPLWGDTVLVVVRDITERKQSELALQQSEARYRNIIETTQEGVWMLNAEGKTSFINQRMATMLGYNVLEMQGKGLMDFIAPADQAQAQIYLDRRQQGIEEQHPFKFQRKDGTPLWAIVSATPVIDDQGQYLGGIGLLTDITQLVQIQDALRTSEMQLGGVLNSSLDGIMALGAVRNEQDTIVDFEWLLSNPTACELVGQAPEHLMGKRLLEAQLPYPQVELFNQYVEVVESGHPIQHEFHVHHNDQEVWFATTVVKLGDGFAITFRNITAIKQSEQTLQTVNKQLEDRIADLKHRHTEMVWLSEMSDFLQACLTVEEACQAITSLVEPLFPDCSGGLFLISASRNRVENVATWGHSLQSAHDFHPKECWGLRRGRSHWVGENRAGLRCQHILDSGAIAATFCLPMIAQGETLGLFYLSTESAATLPEAKQQLARTVAEQISMALSNLQLRETLQYQSIRDPLTGLFNRRYLEEVLSQEVSRAQRKHREIGIIMLDVDHFKSFNDTYGHDAGDHVLQSVGSLLKDSVRGSDVACRYGGEEFTLILPETTLEETAIKAEEIRQAIAQLHVAHQGQALGSLTASLGVAIFPQHGSTGAAVVQAADAALYRAKAAGRNQSIVAL